MSSNESEVRTKYFAPALTMGRIGAVCLVLSIFAFGYKRMLGVKVAAVGLGLMALAVTSEKVINHVR